MGKNKWDDSSETTILANQGFYYIDVLIEGVFVQYQISIVASGF